MNIDIIEIPTRCRNPAAVSHNETKDTTNWTSLIRVLVFNTFRYVKMSGIDIKRRARKKRRPERREY